MSIKPDLKIIDTDGGNLYYNAGKSSVCLCVCVLPNSSETVGRIDFIFGHDIDPIAGMVLIYFS